MDVDPARSSGHLVVVTGLPGSGKTTLAAALAGSMPACRMCPDDWMMTSGIDLWDESARAEIEAFQLALSLDLLRRGQHVVIEWGVWTRAERDALRHAARSIGASVTLRHVTADVDELWRRIVRRDVEGRWGSRSIRRAELDEWATIYEPPTDEELGTYDPESSEPTTAPPNAGSRPIDAALHDWRIDTREYERHEARRGRRHAFEVLDPLRTALVVVDMVPFFIEANPYARGIVPNIRTLASAVRASGGVVAWVLPGTEEPSPARLEFLGASVAETYRTSGGAGGLHDRLWREFDVAADDVLVEKSAAGAFFPGRCALPSLLERAGVDTVIIAGTVANVCCESTARDASTLGYRVIMVADANAAMRDHDLNATLHTIYRSFGDVRTTDDLVRLLARSSPD